MYWPCIGDQLDKPMLFWYPPVSNEIFIYLVYISLHGCKLNLMACFAKIFIHPWPLMVPIFDREMPPGFTPTILFTLQFRVSSTWSRIWGWPRNRCQPWSSDLSKTYWTGDWFIRMKHLLVRSCKISNLKGMILGVKMSVLLWKLVSTVCEIAFAEVIDHRSRVKVIHHRPAVYTYRPVMLS